MRYLIDLNLVPWATLEGGMELQAVVTNQFGKRKLMSMPCPSKKQATDKLPSFLMQVGLELHHIETQLRYELAHPNNPVVADPSKLG